MASVTWTEVVHVEIDHPKMAIRGYLQYNLETDKIKGKEFVFFLGIPYAEPPLEKDKWFEPPEPYVYDPEKDGDPFEARKGFEIVPQIDGSGFYKIEIPDSSKEKLYESLNCLYLNIYVPKRPKDISDPLAVMVYFHGGGFFQGSGNYDERTPESMMRQGVLLVTVNYRLGPFGFLNFHAENGRGNAGLKDQVMALRWVRDNIRNFGGDPNNVTIWGESTGGSCVNFHLISPLSKGLFHKAIIQSGGIYCPWWFSGDQSKIIANYEKYSRILEEKKKMVVEKLIEASSTDVPICDWQIANLKRKPDCTDVDVGPSIESYKTDAFLPYGVNELMKDANPVPILAGITAIDGYSISQLGVPFDHFVNWILDNKSFCDFLTANLLWEKKVVEKYFCEIRDEYFDLMELRGSHPDEYNRFLRNAEAKRARAEADRVFNAGERLAKFCTDLWFYQFYDNFKFRNEGKPSAPIYIYEFDLVSRINSSREYRERITGAAHSDDIAYLLPNTYRRSSLMPYSDYEQKKITTMCSLWASFCKTGTPKSMCHNIEWLPHTEEKPCYLYIGNDLVLKNGRLNERRWNILKIMNQEDEKIKAQKSDPHERNTRSSFRITLAAFRKTFDILSLSSKSKSSTGKAEFCPDTLDVPGHVESREGLTPLTSQIPSRNGYKRHSPSRSPTSESKTCKDESSETKKKTNDS